MFEPRAVHAFEGLLAPVRPDGARLWVQPLGPALATVIARKGQGQALAERVRNLYGLALPQSPSRAAAAADIAFIATAPGGWLAVKDGGGLNWAGELATQLRGLASVADQSGGLAVVRLGGPAVCEVLAKGLFLDFHLSAFPVGSAAASNLNHVGIWLWRLDAEVFDLAVPRSFAADVAHWLQDGAIGAGLALRL